MKKLFFLVLAIMLNLHLVAQVHVSGYYKKNGTYVQPYTRSSPDGIPSNNYSYPGNTNPYTGKVATGNVDSYLKNYDKNLVSINPETKYKFKDYDFLKTGLHMKVSLKLSSGVLYDIFDTENNYCGYIIISDNQSATLYNKNSDTVKSFSNINSVLLPIEDDSNQNRSIERFLYPNITPSTKDFTNDNFSFKTYIKDKNGNYTGYYLMLYDSNEDVKKYGLFNHNDIQTGTVEIYSNGEKFYYNSKGNLIKHTKKFT